MYRILLIEDDPDILRIVSTYLEQSSFEVDIALDGPSGLSKALSLAPDLIILDWMLPGLDGLELLKRLRKEQKIPVIMITARTEEIDRIMGLEFGADDYMTKPFSVRELLARVRAVLRRSEEIAHDKPLKRGGLCLDPNKRTAYLNHSLLDLTTIEFNLLFMLMEQRGRVFTRDTILQRIWGTDFEGTDRVVDVHISNLRRKLEAMGGIAVLQTIRGVGYKVAE